MGSLIEFPMPADRRSVPVEFTQDELWILQSVLRHEQASNGEWKFPPWGVDLNDAICEAIVFCVENKQKEVSVSLSRGDLLAIDYHINPFYKDPLGKQVGKDILLKVMRARMALREAPWETVQEPDDQDMRTRFAVWKVRQRNEGQDAD